MGGSLGKQKSSSTQNPNLVWGDQSPYLTNLYSRAKTASYGGGSDPYAQNVASGAAGGFNNLIGGGFQNPQLTQNLQALGSGQYQNQALGGAIQAGLGDINRNFQQNIMPGINTGTAMTNTSGGSRQGIAQGLAGSKANRQASDFVNRMYSNNFGQTVQSMLGANQQLTGLNAQQNAAQMGGLGMAPNIAQLGIAPQQNYWNQQFMPLRSYGDIIGQPTVLGQGGSSNARGWNMSGGMFGG